MEVALLLVGLLHCAGGKDTPIISNYMIKHTETCPDEGYFFQRELSSNTIDPGPCYLCFCRENGTAVCWLLENKRCDKEKYHHHKVGRSSRKRRNPKGFGDKFFYDSKDNLVIDKQMTDPCTPGETFTDGCPPEDWCLSCTVCECDENEQWDCRIFSSCSEDGNKNRLKKKKSAKKRRHPCKRYKGRHLGKTKKPNRTVPTKAKLTNKSMKKKKNSTKNPKKQNIGAKVIPRQKIIIKKKKSMSDDPLHASTFNPKRNVYEHLNPMKETIIKKDVGVRKPLSLDSKIRILTDNQELIKIDDNKVDDHKLIKMDDNKLELNEDYSVDQGLVNRVMLSVQKIIQQEIEKMDKSRLEKVREMKKLNNNVKQFNYKKNNLDFEFMRSKRDINGLERDATTDVIVGAPENSTQNHLFKQVMRSTPKNNDKPNDYSRYFLNLTYDNTNYSKTKAEGNNTKVIVKMDDQNLKNTKTLNNALEVLQKHNDLIPLKKSYMKGLKYKLAFKQLKKITPKNVTQAPNILDKKQKSTLKLIKAEPCDDVCNENCNLNATDKTKCQQKIANKIIFPCYLKSLINKIFIGTQTKDRHGNDSLSFDIFNFLCENKQYCNINEHQIHVLLPKIKSLNSNFKNMLETVNIIRGLINGLNISKHGSQDTYTHDVEKLKFLLKTNTENTNLTEIQKQQLKYLKKNTKMFTELVTIITNTLTDIKNVINSHRQPTAVRRIRQSTKNVTVSFEKIKQLIMKHNLAENRFLKNMYRMIMDLESKTMIEQRKEHVTKDVYVKKVVYNLTKLKRLVQALGSIRKKRDVDDDLNYWMTLMEVLMKRNVPFLRTQVNDGIDVLLETIKNAPDIKTINSKTLTDEHNIDNVVITERDKTQNAQIVMNQFKELPEFPDAELDSSNSILDSSISSVSGESKTDVIPTPYQAIQDEDKYISNYATNTTNIDSFDVTTKQSVKTKSDGIPSQRKLFFIAADNEEDAFSEINDNDLNDTTSTTVKNPTNVTDYDDASKSGETRGNIDWIIENFGRETNYIIDKFREKTTTIVNDISDETDITTEKGNKKKEEYILRQKNMNLMNSLEYGTEKVDVDSKSEEEDKYLSDLYLA